MSSYEPSIKEIMDWWKTEIERILKEELRIQNELKASIIHFFSTATGSGPLCEQGDHGEWVRYDHTAIGKICPKCQKILNRKIE